VSDQYQNAVVDRIVDGQHAVLLINDSLELVVPATELPDGASEGSWLRVTIRGNTLVNAALDAEKTSQMAADVHEKMERLRTRGRKRRE
jgi:hypothetical protein